MNSRRHTCLFVVFCHFHLHGLDPAFLHRGHLSLPNAFFLPLLPFPDSGFCYAPSCLIDTPKRSESQTVLCAFPVSTVILSVTQGSIWRCGVESESCLESCNTPKRCGVNQVLYSTYGTVMQPRCIVYNTTVSFFSELDRYASRFRIKGGWICFVFYFCVVSRSAATVARSHVTSPFAPDDKPMILGTPPVSTRYNIVLVRPYLASVQLCGTKVLQKSSTPRPGVDCPDLDHHSAVWQFPRDVALPFLCWADLTSILSHSLLSCSPRLPEASSERQCFHIQINHNVPQYCSRHPPTLHKVTSQQGAK